MTQQSSFASLQDQTYSLLKSMVEDGRLQPGERLLESKVAEAFGISRSPARLALQSLARDALVVPHPVRGWEVAGSAAGPVAALERVRIVQPRQWERMYSEVEQALYAHGLFGPVRVNDAKLATHFGVSRTVTRDVLARMHSIGMVVKDEAGHWVAEQITPARIQNLFELRQLLEPVALVQAAPHLPTPLLLQIRGRVLDAMRRRSVNSEQFDQLETDLHMTVLSYAPNKELTLAAKRTEFLFGPTRHLIDPLLGLSKATVSAVLREHLQVIEALIAADAGLAAGSLRVHISAAVARWLERFQVASKRGRVPLPPFLTAVR